MSTIAQVSITDSDYFSFSDCERFCDSILELMRRTYEGHLAPVSHYIKAHVATMRVFADGVTTDRKPLKTMVLDASQWKHFWSSYIPSRSGMNERAASSSMPDPPAGIQQQIDKAEALRRKWQSDKDKARNAGRNSGEDGHRRAELTPGPRPQKRPRRH